MITNITSKCKIYTKYVNVVEYINKYMSHTNVCCFILCNFFFPIFCLFSKPYSSTTSAVMNVACCSVCDGHVSERHSRCQGGPWNERLRHPNFISGYTGKIPINLRWDGSENLWETRDFHSGCKEPGKF